MENTKLKELTERLYGEGLEKGRAEADRLVADAKAEAAKIVKEAETMIKRVQLFAERFDAVEHSFQDTLKCFDSLKILTADKGSSIITSARQIISYGVKEEKRKRSLSSVYVEEEDNSMLGSLEVK